MERKIYRGVIPALVSLLIASNAAAIQVHDPVHTAETTKVLSEAKKSLEEAKRIYSEVSKVQAKLGALGKGVMSIDAWLQRGENVAQCFAPGLMDALKLPDGAAPKYMDFCQASQSMYEALMPQEGTITKDGKPLPRSEHLDNVRQRRDDVLAEAAISGIAAARTNKNGMRTGVKNAQSIITRSNQAETIDDLMRENNRALSLILGELVEQRAILAGILENIAADNVRKIPTTTRVVPISELRTPNQ